jgi:hypothetical protein
MSNLLKRAGQLAREIVTEWVNFAKGPESGFNANEPSPQNTLPE